MISNICFVIAGTLWAIELIPQLIKTIKTKQVEDFSIVYPVMCACAYLTFFIGCIADKSWVLLFSHLMPFVLVSTFLGLILKYRVKR